MQIAESSENATPAQATPNPRKKYAPPVLTLFGHVAALTQSSGCSASNDGANAVCQVGASSMGPMASDVRLKEDLVRIGEHPFGFGLYLFSYKKAYRDECGHSRQFGVLAQEVEHVMPEAVAVRADGFKAVDYEMLGIRRNLH